MAEKAWRRPSAPDKRLTEDRLALVERYMTDHAPAQQAPPEDELRLAAADRARREAAAEAARRVTAAREQELAQAAAEAEARRRTAEERARLEAAEEADRRAAAAQEEANRLVANMSLEGQPRQPDGRCRRKSDR